MAAPAPGKRSWISWKGCLFGCLGLLVVGVLLSVSTGYWLVRKGEFEVETTILDTSSDAYARIYLREGDELLVDFLTLQTTRLNEASPGYAQMPSFFKSWGQASTRRDFKNMMPMEVEVRGNFVEEELTATIGFSIYSGFARVGYWFAKRAARKHGNVTKVGDKEVLLFDPNAEGRRFMLHLEGNMVYFSNAETAMSAMLSPDAALAETHNTDSRLRDLDLTAPIYGFMKDGGEEDRLFDLVAGMVEGSPPELAVLREVDMASFHMQLLDQETIEGAIILHTAVKGVNYLADLEAMLEALTANTMLDVQMTLKEQVEGYRIDFTATGFGEMVNEIQRRTIVQ